tara:strand:- start:727 stop:963 length:237 start_codon:yes stop_codon:yes gene_type:complete
MEKYNKFLRDITKLVENGLFASKDIKKDIEQTIKLKMDNIVSQLNLVSREEFEVQKKLIQKLQKDINKHNKKVKKLRR